MRRGEIGADAAQFGAVAVKLGNNGVGAAGEVGILRLEGQAALLGVFELLAALGELLVHERDRVAHLAARTAEILFLEDVDHLLRDVLRELRVLRV